jgi:hypothetical protein
VTKIKFSPGSQEIKLTLPRWLTAELRPGKYRLAVSGKNLTCVNQPLVIGPGAAKAPAFFTVVYGDYGQTYPQASAWDAPDVATASFQRTSQLGFNLMVDRLGHPLEMSAFSPAPPRADVAVFVRSLQADQFATPPQKLLTAPAFLQAMAGYGALGIRQMAILMGNDAGLPLGGPGFDGRKPEQILKDLATTTEALKDYPAFRGWSWSSNWWVFGDRGSSAAKTPEEKAAYEAALKKAAATGEWDDVLDRVAGYRLGYAVDAQATFNRKLAELAPGKVTAVACPFRNVQSYPPISLSNVDETDMQAQWEQIALPYHGPLNVDFYKRPNKRAWGHPEIWNDAGTGSRRCRTTTLWPSSPADACSRSTTGRTSWAGISPG